MSARPSMSITKLHVYPSPLVLSNAKFRLPINSCHGDEVLFTMTRFRCRSSLHHDPRSLPDYLALCSFIVRFEESA